MTHVLFLLILNIEEENKASSSAPFESPSPASGTPIPDSSIPSATDIFFIFTFFLFIYFIFSFTGARDFY